MSNDQRDDDPTVPGKPIPGWGNGNGTEERRGHRDEGDDAVPEDQTSPSRAHVKGAFIRLAGRMRVFAGALERAGSDVGSRTPTLHALEEAIELVADIQNVTGGVESALMHLLTLLRNE